jgi:uncharacterized protein involved in outer membrane biogenesis
LKIVLGFVALLALLLALLSLFNLNAIKPWLNEKVSDATGRPFAINGDLMLNWQRPVAPQTGWRRFVPWPHLQANDITLGNPDWATTGPTMARIQRIDFNIDLLPLLARTISISSLVLTEPQLNLEKEKDGKRGEPGRNNWTFKKDEKESESKWNLAIHDLKLTRGTVRYVDAEKLADVTARIDTSTDGGTAYELAGEFNKEKVTGKGLAGALLSLQKENVQYPVKAELHVGKTDIYADGTFTDPTKLSALDVNLKIEGANMALLFPLTGILLPETPKFSTAGRVHGKLAKDNIDLTYEKFTGKVGSSDIGGTLRYLQKGETGDRPMLRGEVASNYLNIKDLSALVGSDSDADRKKRGAETTQPANKALPVEPFKTDRWNRIDIDVAFSGKKIVRSEDLPIDNLYTKIKMANGALTLAPLNFGVAGGKLKTQLRIDGRADPAKAELQMSAQGLQVRKLFPAAESMRASVGELYGEAKLTAVGNSPAALLGSSNGELHALVSEGTVSKFILEAMGLNIGSVVISKLFGDKQVQLNCAATDFKITDGLMEAQTFVIDTHDATIGVNGNVNLAKETMDLKIRPESKGVRIISLRSPLYVAGTFKKPDVGVDKGVLAAKAGAAVVLGTVAAPAAALLALINPGPGQDSPCGKLLADARKPPVAPPPGKTAPEASSRTGQKSGG